MNDLPMWIRFPKLKEEQGRMIRSINPILMFLFFSKRHKRVDLIKNNKIKDKFQYQIQRNNLVNNVKKCTLELRVQKQNKKNRNETFVTCQCHNNR